MADIGEIVSRIERVLKKQGFKRDLTGIQKDFAWKPDVFLTKGSESRAFLIRQTDSVPNILVERMALTRSRKKRFFINIVFLKDPKPQTKKTLALYGIGIQLMDVGKLVESRKSKNFSASIKTKKLVVANKKMRRTDIFLSSQQEIPEREAARRVINDINRKSRFPVFPFQAEDDDRFGGSRSQTKRCIDEGLRRCEWFVGILAEECRYWVTYEVKQAIEKDFKDGDITIYVRTTLETQRAWKTLLGWIKNKNFKYLPFSDKADLKTKLYRRILSKIERIHRNLGIPMYDL